MAAHVSSVVSIKCSYTFSVYFSFCDSGSIKCALKSGTLDSLVGNSIWCHNPEKKSGRSSVQNSTKSTSQNSTKSSSQKSTKSFSKKSTKSPENQSVISVKASAASFAKPVKASAASFSNQSITASEFPRVTKYSTSFPTTSRPSGRVSVKNSGISSVKKSTKS